MDAIKGIGSLFGLGQDDEEGGGGGVALQQGAGGC